VSKLHFRSSMNSASIICEGDIPKIVSEWAEKHNATRTEEWEYVTPAGEGHLTDTQPHWFDQDFDMQPEDIRKEKRQVLRFEIAAKSGDERGVKNWPDDALIYNLELAANRRAIRRYESCREELKKRGYSDEAISYFRLISEEENKKRIKDTDAWIEKSKTLGGGEW